MFDKGHLIAWYSVFKHTVYVKRLVVFRNDGYVYFFWNEITEAARQKIMVTKKIKVATEKDLTPLYFKDFKKVKSTPI